MADNEERIPMAAIGASAGGIEALITFLDAVPEGSGVAYLVLVHMAANPESKLTEVLGHHSRIPVQMAQTGAAIKPDTVYVAPPGFDMVVRDGLLMVQPRDESVQPQRPVDNLFESVAAYAHECAVCIVLSGSGTNGTAGIRNVKAEGGLVVAQEPSTARFDGMPSSAIASGMVDLMLTPADMPQAVLEFVHHAYVRSPDVDGDEQPGHELAPVLALLKARTNRDFRGYKKRTLGRRIFRRMGLRRVEKIEDYLQLLRAQPEEVDALVGDLLISVTGFFRDSEAWGELDERVIRPLVQEREPSGSIRVWVPACATGEEAYTVAMLLLQRAGEAQKTIDIKVFATDADINALAKARSAVYPASAVAGMSPEYLRRFFDQQDDTFRVKKELRELVIFAPQDILTDPPFSRLDLVSCRNLLIYLEAPVQRRVISLLHFALREGGYLFLGNAEAISGNESLYRVISKKWRIFRRTGPVRHDLVKFPASGASKQIGSDAMTNPPVDRSRQKIIEQAQKALVDEFAPPSILIDEHYRILYYHGNTEPFLRQQSGEPTNDLLVLLRDGLRTKLRSGVQSVLKEGKKAVFTTRIRRQDHSQSVGVTIAPAHAEPGSNGGLLVSFSEIVDQVAPANQNAGNLESDALITEHDLEEELRSVREELRGTIEQLESSNEEMKASNEEITSMNEELQSTNEELETSKEELQSLNEELSTVNAQIQSKVEELENRTNDLNNLLNSSDIATLFLDTRFSIRWFTPPVRRLMDILPTDIGRPVNHFAMKFEDRAFLNDAEQVLKSLIPRETEVRTEKGQWYVRRMLPYRTEDNRIEGVVVTFIDITDRRRWEQEIRDARDYAERIVDTLQESLLVIDADLRVTSANPSFYEAFKLSPSEVEGRSIFQIGRGDWEIPELRRLLATDLAEDRVVKHIIEHEFAQVGRRALTLNIRFLGRDRATLLAINDVTSAQEHERRLEVLLAELQHRVKNILASVQAIARMTRQRSNSLGEFWDAFQGRLVALAGTQDLLTRAKLERVGIKDLIERELAAQGANPQDYMIDGPDLALSAKAAENLALALHELTTNTTKHGALAQEEGHVEVKWSVVEDRVHFEWIEVGGPRVKKPERHGFGMELIEKAIPYQLRGKTKLEFLPEGFRWRLDLPLSGNVGSFKPGSE